MSPAVIKALHGNATQPFIAIQFYYWVKEFIRGTNHRSPGNTTQYDCIILNLLCMES